MDQMKKFFKYFILVLLLYILGNVLINALLKASYTKIEKYEINTSPLYVDITDAQASQRDGTITGIVKNNSDKIIENKYLKVDMLSKNNNVLGTKYIRIEKIEINQLKNFEVKFDYDNVKSFKIELTDTMPEDVDFIDLVKENVNHYVTQFQNII